MAQFFLHESTTGRPEVWSPWSQFGRMAFGISWKMAEILGLRWDRFAA
jgi:hypothetical protein